MTPGQAAAQTAKNVRRHRDLAWQSGADGDFDAAAHHEQLAESASVELGVILGEYMNDLIERNEPRF